MLFAMYLGFKDNPITLIFPLGMLALCFGVFKFSRKRFQQELNSEPLYDRQGGGRLEGVRFSFPFVRIAVYPEFLILSYGWKRNLIEREHFRKLEEKHGLIGSYCIVHHGKPGIQPELQFSPLKLKDFKESLFRAQFIPKENV